MKILLLFYFYILFYIEALTTPSTTKLSVVNVPVLSKQQISILPANGILKGSVQNMP